MEFIIMDNDSGYVSHNHESNLDLSSEPVYKSGSCFGSDYLNEDALLEKPTLTNQRYDSFDSVINSSEGSVKTEFSGFEDSDLSNASFVVPEAKPLVWDCKKWKENNAEKSTTPKESPNKPRPIKVLSNVTNTYEQTHLNQAAGRNLPADKENVDPSETPRKHYESRLNSDVSPDLFSEEEDALNSSKMKPMKKEMPKEKYFCSKDTKLLKNVQGSLNGVYPPPSVTIVQMNVEEMLKRIEANKNLFWKSATATNATRSSLLNGNADCLMLKWPEILKARFHGLHYNRSKISEDLEHLCLKYAERYVGNETQSSCTVFESNPPSSQKRRMSKPRWISKSPGRRLSHLARRRITFSSSNLQANSSSTILGSRARQILVDVRKMSTLKKSPKKTPKKTPSKSPFKTSKKTPSSSAKKKLALRFREMSGEFENMPSCSNVLSFKRPLFGNENESGSMEKKSTKRALFLSPNKNSSPKKSSSPFKLGLDKKRKRCDFEENFSLKFPRSTSLDAATLQQIDPKLKRTLSDNFNAKPEELSDQHKKKLQWAVYESLRLQNVTPTHPQYKVFASVLARVTRKFLQNLRFEGRTTEKMFRIARHHSYAVVKGKTVDQIVNEYMKHRLKNQKPQGYVALEEIKQVNKENDNSQSRAEIVESIEQRREHAGSTKTRFSNQRIDRIKKVISFEDMES